MKRTAMHVFHSALALGLVMQVASANAAVLTRGPYLQMGNSDSVTVRWRSDTASNSRVRVGTDPANLDLVFDNSTNTTEHSVRVSGLAAETRYYYSVGSTTETLGGGNTSTFFQTAPITGSDTPFRVWVIGDAGTGSSGQAAVYNAYRTFTGSSPTHLWLQLGDNAYNDGTDAEFQARMFNVYPDMLRQSVTWPTLGNHDGHSADSATQTGPYYNIFTLPTNAEAGGIASGTEAYYSFDYGNTHFVVLDSYETSRAVGGAMYNWVQADLQATTADWIIAVWHHPPYTKGSHNSDTETELVQMRQNFVPLLESYGVDLILSGHSHSYERSKFINGHHGTSSTFSDTTHVIQSGSGRVDGTGAYYKVEGATNAGAVYAVAGSSGEASGGLLNHPAMYISLNELGSMVLDINDRTLLARFLNNNGTIRDYFTLTKEAVPVSTSINGVVWNDVDADGIREGGEALLSGIQVRLYNASNTLISTQTTNSSGIYSFSNVAGGNYYVQFIRGNYTISPQNQGSNDTIDSDPSPASGNTATFSVTAGISINNTDAGMYIPAGTQTTVNLRDGLNGYAGTSDSYVASGRTSTNYGGSSSLLADGSDGNRGRLVSLLRWNVSAIPASAIITDARITVNVFNNTVGSYDLYAMSASWTESGATWSNTTPTSNQGVLIGSFSPTTTGSKTITLNSAGLALVKGWVDGTIANNGIMIIDRSSSDGIDIRSSEYSTNSSQRPNLSITYQ